jgi:hypothetical protein
MAYFQNADACLIASGNGYGDWRMMNVGCSVNNGDQNTNLGNVNIPFNNLSVVSLCALQPKACMCSESQADFDSCTLNV